MKVKLLELLLDELDPLVWPELDDELLLVNVKLLELVDEEEEGELGEELLLDWIAALLELLLLLDDWIAALEELDEEEDDELDEELTLELLGDEPDDELGELELLDEDELD